MRKMLLTLTIAVAGLSANAQTVATFESLSLSKSKDTSYINFTMPGKDVGFNNGLAGFPCVYDTSGGYEYWSYGFSYSNWTDSVKSGFMNQYSAKAAQGFAGSEKYVVGYGTANTVRLTGAAIGQSVMGFYITNSTYAYNSMRDGDAFAKKFTGAAKDWFRLDVFPYKSGSITKDSVSFYLADFRNTDTTLNYIVNDWQWVNLIPLGHADSLYFRLSSSDNSGPYMNTPAYFCLDNFTTNETGLSVGNTPVAGSIKVYPNPATTVLVIEPGQQHLRTAAVADLSGRIISSHEVNDQRLEINTSALVPGTYMLLLNNGSQQTAVRFQKQ